MTTSFSLRVLAALTVGLVGFRSTLAAQVPFTAGNLAVLQAAASANNTTASVVEVSPDSVTPGTPVQTIAISGTGASALRISSSATSTGYLSNSADRTLLTLMGANSTNTTSNVNTLNPRAVATFNAAAGFSLATTYTGGSGNQTRSATTLDNSAWFIGDQGGLYTNGATAATVTANLRAIKAFGGVVYAAQASGTVTNIAVSTIASPTATAVTGLPGLTNLSDLQDFFLISSAGNSTFDILYVLRATANTVGTINKYSLVSGSWVANGTHPTAFGGFGLAAEKSGAGARLYVSTGLGALTGNSLLRLTDTAGYNATIAITTASNVTLYTAPAGAILKGVAFAPLAASQPDLAVTLTVPAAANVGANFDYTLVASNSGGASASGVSVQFTLPAGLNYVTATGSAGFTGAQSAGVVTFTGGILGAGASANLTVTVNAPVSGTFTAPAGAAVIDPAGLVAESNEANNNSPIAASILVTNPANAAPTIAFTAGQISLLPPDVSAVLSDPTDPAATTGVGVTVGDAETAAASLVVTATSSNSAVVPDANLTVSGSGANRFVRINPVGVGYATVTISVSDGVNATSLVVNYAASAAASSPGTSRALTGASDASTAQAVDANYLFVADDESQALRLYHRSNSGLPVASFDFTALLNLTDLSGGIPREVDLEASARSGNRIYWLGSLSNAASGNARPNRNRIFATDLTGTGAAAALSFVGYYDRLKNDLIGWDQGNAHGLGANYFGFAASAATGVIPESPDGSGFNMEGAEFAPDGNTLYLAFRAPIVPASARTRALLVPVTNVAALVTASPAAGPAVFGTPIVFDFGGRGIREIRKNAANEYLISAGPASGGTGVPAADFRLYTWTGNPADAPVLRVTDYSAITGNGSIESIVEVPAPLGAFSSIQVLSDNGDTIYYNDGTIAKDLVQPNFKKFRSDVVTLGQAAYDLSALTTSAGVLSPAFQVGTAAYTVMVANAVTDITVTPSVATAASTIQVRINGGTSGSVASGAPSGSLPLAVGSNLVEILVTAEDGAMRVHTVTFIRASPNQSPVAGALDLRTTRDTAVTLPASRLLAASTDPDGDAITLTSVTATGTGTVDLTVGIVTYTPAAGFIGTDNFSYAISDGRGGSASATVTVTVTPTNGAGSGTLNVGTIVVGPTSAQVNAFGIPGRTYTIEYTDDLGGSWTILGNANANAFGGINFTDANQPRPSQRFYRVR